LSESEVDMELDGLIDCMMKENDRFAIVIIEVKVIATGGF
jgi:hypothetical protein